MCNREEFAVRKYLIGFLAALAATTASAEPTGEPVTVTGLRPYSGGAAVYMDVAPASLCSTSTYKIDLSASSGKEMYAAALSALITGRKIRVEIPTNAGCTG
jgi:hypothetical protein